MLNAMKLKGNNTRDIVSSGQSEVSFCRLQGLLKLLRQVWQVQSWLGCFVVCICPCCPSQQPRKKDPIHSSCQVGSLVFGRHQMDTSLSWGSADVHRVLWCG